MFSFDQVLSQLYPNKNIEELQKIIDRDFNDMTLYPEYDTRAWLAIKKDDLIKPDVQICLAKTLYISQFLYNGVVNEIMRAFEDWTDGLIVFDNFPMADQDFLERFYCFLGWLNFKDISFMRKLFLLDTRFLLQAAVWNLPIYFSVQQYFAKQAYLEGMREDAKLFVGAIARNQTSLGAENRIKKTISEWASLFDGFIGSSVENRIDEFMKEKMEVQRLDEVERRVLSKILTLYWGLKGGFIYREIEDAIPGDYQPKERKESKTVDDYYLEALFRADDKQMLQWLQTSGEAAYWMFLTRKPDRFIKKLIYVLFTKVDLDNEEQVPLLLEFFALLQDFGLVGAEDLIYFDEAKEKVMWNEDNVVSLKPEPEGPLVPQPLDEILVG